MKSVLDLLINYTDDDDFYVLLCVWLSYNQRDFVDLFYACHVRCPVVTAFDFALINIFLCLLNLCDLTHLFHVRQDNYCN